MNSFRCNLPPGCTERDVSEAAGAFIRNPICRVCGDDFVCEEELQPGDEPDDICPDCKEREEQEEADV